MKNSAHGERVEPCVLCVCLRGETPFSPFGCGVAALGLWEGESKAFFQPAYLRQ
jgi:hypothetical protein